ncbi:MAG: glucosaminidase domain-containing protein [Levilactobacillus sp.]|jgi:flagellum-specific peptidoglycan hydrolase FlgJ|uniref:glycoside hydrolase family 73 protein n=1 Tax=Levilactobacillus sp. TaxID=2767919 RepID=UPI002587671A|nr:glucosaminidase domain-containing protein [Levilactobacillus sp.]MCH4123992.1 glucosaminidase domain-containing protein [Levilactobacillus sp.]MCI1554172.1 glucosaminidase domain-containing protein [Levilactobacillus sp.]MCI1598925.1 glucosaminidase domain-containing protein [Levilactobacillus sp.]
MKRTKRWLLATLIVGVGLGGLTIGKGTGHAATTDPQSFISTLKSPVTSVANKYKLYPSVMMAQAALESAWGTSTLTTTANNYFGIKGSYNGQSVTMQTAEYDSNGQLYYTDANFRKYPSAKASMTDNATLLRGGTSYNPTLYSGTWRENAATYSDAANALTNTYATAPTYGSSLISIIKTYGLNTLLDGSTSSASSSSSASSESKPAAKPEPTYATAKYYGGASGQTARLNSKYTSYRLYNHVKGTRANITKTAWKKVPAGQGVQVYLDMRGVKTTTAGNKTTWYRIRFSNSASAKKYWLYGKALTLPTVKYSKGTAKVKVNSALSGYYYNHVYNSPYLAKSMGKLKALTAKSYTADNQAIRTQDGVKTTWYRIKVGDKKYWIAANEAAVSPQYDYVTYANASGTKKLSAKYKKYHLYNHVKKTHFNQQTFDWPSGVKKGTKVTVNYKGVKTTYGTTWYRFKFSGDKTNYWVDSRALA